MFAASPLNGNAHSSRPAFDRPLCGRHTRFNENFPLPKRGIPRESKFTCEPGALSAREPVGRKRGCEVQPSELKGETIMFIGNFRPVGDNYTGVIKTLTFKIDAVFEAIEKKGEKAPDYRVTTGNTDVGVAWKKTSRPATRT